MTNLRPAVLALVFSCLAGCDKPGATATTGEDLQFGTPLEPRLQETYMRTCRNCHQNDVPGMPRAGDAADWQPRAAQGLDVLVQHAMYGYKGMPAMGFCHDCSEADMRALVAWMAGLKLPDARGGETAAKGETAAR